MSLLDRLSEPLSDSKPPTPAPEGALTDRLWSTKLVPFPNAPEYVDDEPPANASDDEDADARLREPALEPLREGDSGALRTHALLIESDTLLHMATRNVMELVSALMPEAPLGLEWVSDTTLVLVFTSEAHARSSFKYLTLDTPLNPLEPLTPIPARAIDASSPFTVRAALASDIKKKDAARTSSFYKNERQQRREQRPYDRRPSGRGDYERSGGMRGWDRDEEERRRYPRMADGPQEGDRRAGGRGGRPPRRTREEELEALDRELDGFVTGTVGGSSGARPSRTAEDLDAEMDAWNQEREAAQA